MMIRALPAEAPPEDPRQATIILRKEMLGWGLSNKAIASLISDGTIRRIRYGTYVFSEAWEACDEAGRYGLVARAVLRRAKSEVALSHLSALGEWDVPLWDVDTNTVHLTRLDRRAGRAEAGVRQHLGQLREDDLTERRGVRLTTPTRSALDAMTVLDVEHALVVVNDLLHRGLTTPEELEAMRVFMERWPGTLHHQLVLRLSSGLCESVGESRTLFHIWRQGLPRPLLQHAIYDEMQALVARVDFAWPEHKVFLEFDGKVKYEGLLREGESASDVVWREKKREDMIRRLTGWICIRVTWADLYHPENLAERIRAAFAQQAAVG